MSKVNIYLAGPVYGCDKSEANDWRLKFRRQLHDHMISGVSPLRCEPLVGDRYGFGDVTDPRFGTPEAIAAKNFMDVQRCDLTLAYFPADLTEAIGPSIGTIGELAWAFSLHKPTILVSTHPKLTQHAMILACSRWRLRTLDEAFELITGLFQVYT